MSLSETKRPTEPLGSPRRGPYGAAADVLRRAQAGQSVIQDFCPLAESIEWELGQKYLQERGTRAFVSDAVPVPFAINNDGNFSTQAAELVFASLLHDPHTHVGEIYVLELGVGIGLFARFFLDHFRELCLEHGPTSPTGCATSREITPRIEFTDSRVLRFSTPQENCGDDADWGLEFLDLFVP